MTYICIVSNSVALAFFIMVCFSSGVNNSELFSETLTTSGYLVEHAASL